MDDLIEVAGYRLAPDRAYDPDHHFWARVVGPERVRIGMDPLGVETSGTLAQLAFLPVNEQLRRGEPFGSLEAAKFVGPLTSPLSGRVAAINDAVMADPTLVERDPFGDGWLIELSGVDIDGEMAGLLSGAERIAEWFAAKVEEYRLKGVLAE